MLNIEPTVSYFLDRSRPNTEGKCLIKLNLYCKPNKRRYATTFHVSSEEWEKLNGGNLRDPELRKVRASLKALQVKAEETIKSISPFSFVAFEEAFLNRREVVKKSNSLKHWFEDYIEELKKNDQIGSSITYRNTIASLSAFRSGLLLQDITPVFLENYERHMTSIGRSTATIGMYLRQLRCIINQAIAAKVLSRESYPFASYTIPSGRNVKKALEPQEVKSLLNHRAESDELQKALDFWLISYLCSGINFADIVQLKPSNLHGNYLEFVRVKTRRTKKKDLRPIKIGLPPKAIELIEKHRNSDLGNPFLFPILEEGLTASTIKYRTQNFTKWVNFRVKKIAVELEIKKPATTYAARHSFSTILKKKGVATAFIQESLGHSSIQTTEDYLDSFADDEKLSVANRLTEL